MSDYQMQEVRVSRIETITAQVKRFTLMATSGQPLPAFQGGSHIIVQIRDGENLYSNAYSLMSSPFDTSAWQIAVRLEEASKGGSRYLHQKVKPGDTLTISTPNNLFALAPQAQQHLLIAGGIGITPFLSQIPELEHSQAEWQLHYCSPACWPMSNPAHIFTPAGQQCSTMPSEKRLPSIDWTAIRYISNNLRWKIKAVMPLPWCWRVQDASLWSRKR